MNIGELIPIAGILGGVAIMWICYKYQELRVFGRQASEEAAREAEEKKRLEERLKVLERIATDPSRQLADEIDKLR